MYRNRNPNYRGSGPSFRPRYPHYMNRHGYQIKSHYPHQRPFHHHPPNYLHGASPSFGHPHSHPNFHHSHASTISPFVPRMSFDMYLCEAAFPKVTTGSNNSGGGDGDNSGSTSGSSTESAAAAGPAVSQQQLTEMLLRRNQELTPSPVEQQLVTGLLGRITTFLDEVIINHPNMFEAGHIEEHRLVGSHKKGTMLSGHNTADLVILFRTLPTIQAVRRLGEILLEKLSRDQQAANSLLGSVSLIPGTSSFMLQSTERGFDIEAPGVTVRCLIATLRHNLHRLEPDLHLSAKVIQENMAAVRHVRWWEENASQTGVKVLVRLLKDLRIRFSGLQPLNPWAIELLAHHSLLFRGNRSGGGGGNGGGGGSASGSGGPGGGGTGGSGPLPIGQAFQRSLQLLSSGLFLPGSAGLIDPCEVVQPRVHASWPLRDQDGVCCTAQTLLRVLNHGGAVQVILGGGGIRSNIATEMTSWNGIIVAPSERVYEKTASLEHHNIDVDEEDDEDEEDEMRFQSGECLQQMGGNEQTLSSSAAR